MKESMNKETAEDAQLENHNTQITQPCANRSKEIAPCSNMLMTEASARHALEDKSRTNLDLVALNQNATIDPSLDLMELVHHVQTNKFRILKIPLNVSLLSATRDHFC